MRFATLSLAPIVATALAACQTMPAQGPQNLTPADEDRMISPILTSADAHDELTYAEPAEARVTHVALDLALDFASQSVAGAATLDLLADPGADTLILDSDDLMISAITDMAGNRLPFTVGADDPTKGAPVTVDIGDARRIVVSYRSNQAEALQWLDPAQTAGGEHMYMFSQGQPILNRTWIPTQDSPGIRQTWEARITAPDPLTVVMSGLKSDCARGAEQAGRTAYCFEMDKPVPPYLIAIAAGDLAFRALGPRTGVWTEPAMLDRAASELADTEAMVVAAEELYGPYRWGRYDMIVLPPAFPYGGMENPVMTFLTPTFIAGDRSLTGLIAHELAHSWSGNLVTNANWTDSWLNEGVTSYFENRIVEEIYGEERAQQEAALSFDAIEETLAEVGMNAPATALHQPLNIDPVGSAIVYDKGAAFLRTIETLVGRERFDAWLRQWFDNHAFEPATSAMILADMRENLVRDEAEAERLMLQEWIFEPGLPSNVARPDPAAFAEVDAAVRAFTANGTIPGASWQGWNTAERLRLMDGLPETLSAETLARLDSAFGLSQTGNNEVLFAWLNLALGNRYEPAVPLAEEFLAEVGRRKFVQPLFETLMGEGEWGQPIARRIYAQTRPSYHSVTTGSVDEVVLEGE